MSITVEPRQTENTLWFNVEGNDCSISIEERPAYCDRGEWIAKLHPRGTFAMEIDEQDGWPRYYFGWDRMLEEIEAWLTRRGQLPGPAVKLIGRRHDGD